MNSDERLQLAKNLLERWTQEVRYPEANRLDVVMAAENVPEAAQALLDARWEYYLAAITGLDQPQKQQVEILYHFCSGAAVLTLRVQQPRQGAKVPTLATVVPLAAMLERELHEMFGIEVQGLPDASRLYLPDDWQEGVYPLLKDARLDQLDSRGDAACQ
jgi:Ni,Fe-hydrogenase III component G